MEGNYIAVYRCSDCMGHGSIDNILSHYTGISSIPAKPVHNHAIVSVHFNYFYCTEICDKLRRDLAIFTYIYLDVDEC